VAACDDETVIGAPFYLMERVRGVILRGRPGEAHARRADARRPRRDVRARDGRRPRDRLARRRAPAASAATTWSGRSAGGAAVGGGAHGRRATVERAAAWLAAHRPPQRERALVHNDFKYDNLVLDPTT
jgi:aminoglycoside phosphotransferase (APT) family kinase protein